MALKYILTSHAYGLLLKLSGTMYTNCRTSVNGIYIQVFDRFRHTKDRLEINYMLSRISLHVFSSPQCKGPNEEIQRLIENFVDSVPTVDDMTDDDFRYLLINTSAYFVLNHSTLEPWAENFRESITPRHTYSILEKIRNFPEIQLSEFQQYVRDFFKHIRIQFLISGDMDGEGAINFTTNLVNRGNWSKIDNVSST